MASITYFSQLQPTPRSPSVAESLAARLRDPAWLLARQWQLGEFSGADAGSPAFARIGWHTTPLASAQLGTASTSLATRQPLEPVVGGESIALDWAARVEIGQTFELLLANAGVSTAVRDKFRTAYPIQASSAGADDATIRFLRVVAGRAINGAALYTAAKAAASTHGTLPVESSLDSATQTAVGGALASFIVWVETTWGPLGTDEPPAWDAMRFEYKVSVTATAPNAGSYTLDAHADTRAEYDWYAFDLTNFTAPSAALAPKFTSVMPGHVRFRGMPNARWWDFETSATDFGAIVPDTRDLAKLLFMDFMLIHGDDWFLAPLEVDSGSLCFIDSLTITDVFGVTTSIARAGADGSPWSIFATTDTNSASFAPFLVVPAMLQSIVSAPTEEVHFLRDETADMAWGIERIVEGPIGLPLPEPPAPSLAPPTGAPAALAYQLATPIPVNWFPLLPVADANGVVSLAAGSVEGGPSSPSSRVMKRLSISGFRLPDEEVPRAGVRLQRLFCRARSADGLTHLWIARRKQLGAGQASSGLRYDLVSDTTPE
jgi:hypothetical protein